MDIDHQRHVFTMGPGESEEILGMLRVTEWPTAEADKLLGQLGVVGAELSRDYNAAMSSKREEVTASYTARVRHLLAADLVVRKWRDQSSEDAAFRRLLDGEL